MNRTYNNLIAALVVVFILAVMVLLSGCAYYSVTKTATETKAKALTWRDSEAPYIEVNVEDGNITKFIFSADSIDNPGFDDIGKAVSTVAEFCVANPTMCS